VTASERHVGEVEQVAASTIQWRLSALPHNREAGPRIPSSKANE
jgi:hypothetical protein